jgi:hypothetical protein
VSRSLAWRRGQCRAGGWEAALVRGFDRLAHAAHRGRARLQSLSRCLRMESRAKEGGTDREMMAILPVMWVRAVPGRSGCRGGNAKRLDGEGAPSPEDSIAKAVPDLGGPPPR